MLYLALISAVGATSAAAEVSRRLRNRLHWRAWQREIDQHYADKEESR